MSAASKTLGGLIAAACIGSAYPTAARAADEPLRVPRVGVLMLSLADSPTGEGLRDGLRELGYIEGKNIVLDSRTTGATDQELRSAAVDLTWVKAGLILAGSTPATRAALEATTLPIVFLVGDPIAAGFVASLARPGGRATGVSMLTTELAGKRLELLRLLVPRARRVCFMMNSANPASALQFKEAQAAAHALGVQLVSLDVQATGGIDAVLSRLTRSEASGVVVSAEIFFLENRARIAQAVRKAKLPAIFPATEYHDAGVLMTYGPSLKDVGHALAVYVDRVLKGAKPAELPIEQLSKFELVVDLREARQLGIAVPDTLLLRADKVIR